jgi:FkbM family methyltransferase
VGGRPVLLRREIGLLLVLLAGIGSVAATAGVFEAVTDRDWALHGLEWPEVLGIALLLLLLGWLLVPGRARPLVGAGQRETSDAQGSRSTTRERARFRLPPDSVLERPGLRWFVSLRRTVAISRDRRQLCLVRYRNGISSCRYPGGMVIPFSMPRTPEELEATSATFFRAYRPAAGDVVVDAGAGIGDEVLVLARLVGKRGRVISIEAHPASFARLESLCRLNRLKNVTCVQAALLHELGDVFITDHKQAIKNTVVTDEGTIPVPAETLDRLLAALAIDHVDFLKMNIEGAEVQALEGFAEGLKRTRNLTVACHDRRAESDGQDAFRTKAVVRSLLESYGFTVSEGPRDENPWDRDYLYAGAPEGLPRLLSGS